MERSDQHRRYGHCPECGAKWTRRSRSRLLSLWRVLWGVQTRFCPACGCRWSESRQPRAGIWRKAIGAIMVFGVVATLVLGAVQGDPKGWFKARVVDVYRVVYGEADHRQKLHEHLGFLYEGVGAEIDDYASHREN
ncbi:MAG: hypothetical protein ACOCX4_08720 [Planctomycetota bacterium]